MYTPKLLALATAIALVIAGLASLATVLTLPLWAHATPTVTQILNGGTGTSTAPGYGKVPIGGASGEYEYVATSTFGITGSVSSVFGRSGAVTAQSGDYTTSLIPEGTNLYYTSARSLADFISNLAATTSVKSITTLPSLSLPYSQLTGMPDLSQYLTLSAWFATTTDQLREGSTNLYFTNARADARFVAGLAATTSVKSITTLPSLSLAYSQLTGTPTIASSTLLADNNTFSGVDKFTNASGDFSGTWQTFSPSHFQTALGFTAVPNTRAINTTWPIQGGGDLSADRTISFNGLATTSPWTTLQLAQVAGNGTLSSIATSSLNLTTSSFRSANVSQWTNDAGYLTSLAGSASSTLLGDSNTFSGIDKFTNAGSDFAGTWQTFSPSHFQLAGTYLTGLGNYGTTTGTALSLSTTTATVNGLTYGLTIVPAANGITFTPAVSGTYTGQAGSVANALTLSNGGSGAASGSTFNGSSAVTISYNSIGAVPTTRNINATFPLTGGGALSGDLTLAFNGIGTSTNPTVGQLPYWTGSNTLGSAATGTASCSGTVSCSSFTILGGNVTITGSGGSGSGNVSTSTNETAGNLAYWTSSSATPALLGKVGTTTLTISGPFAVPATQGYLVGGSNSAITYWGLATTTQPASSNLLVSNGAAGVYGAATSTLTASSPLTGSFTQVGSGGSLGCQTASGSQAGCLSSTDWTTFNSKQAALTFNWPLVNSANTVSFNATTTPWAANQFVYTNAAGLLVTAASSSLNLPNSALQNSTISGIALGGTLAALSATDSTLTFSGSYTGATARTVGLNLGNANTWTAGQMILASSTIGSGTQIGGLTIAGGATTTLNAYIGGNLTVVNPATYSSIGSTNLTTSAGFGTGPSSADMLWIASTTAITSRTMTISNDYEGPTISSAIRAFNAGAVFGSTVTGNDTNAAGGGLGAGRYLSINTAPGYNVSQQSGLSAQILINGTLSSTTNAADFHAEAPTINSGDLISNFSGLWIRGGAVSGTLTNQYGVQIDALTGGTNRWGIYQAGSGDNNYFAGNVGAGTTTPQWPLNPFSSTGPQLSLSNGAGFSQWGIRNDGANLVFATTTLAGTATSTVTNLQIDKNGKLVVLDVNSGYTGVASSLHNLAVHIATSTVWTGTTTSANTFTLVFPFSGTLRDARCKTDAGNLELETKINATALTYYPITSTQGLNLFSSSNTFVAGDVLTVNAGAPATSPTKLDCTYRVTETP